MIRILVEVGSDAVPFRVMVTARNIREALRMVGELYPGLQARVLFPIDPETFFVGESAPKWDAIWLESAREESA